MAFGSECSVDAYLKRKLPRIEDLLSKATSEIYFMGLTLEALRQIVPSIAIALRSNRKIRVLLFEPNKDLTNKVEKLVATSNITEDISPAGEPSNHCLYPVYNILLPKSKKII